MNDSLEDDVPKADIYKADNSVFVPNYQDCETLDKNFVFHIAKVLVKHVGCLKMYSKCLPKYIDHPHILESAKKSDYTILDLLDKSENKSEDMISILQHVHQMYFPHTDDDHPLVMIRKVFGGDVLTNERAYSAQLAMLNDEGNFEQLAGVAHRPDGLHRMMNMLLVFGKHISASFSFIFVDKF